MPLDLALYSRKSAAASRATTGSVMEKRRNSRSFLLQLAGQDPGDVHEALRLDSDNLGSLNVVVSDDFLDKVC